MIPSCIKSKKGCSENKWSTFITPLEILHCCWWRICLPKRMGAMFDGKEFQSYMLRQCWGRTLAHWPERSICNLKWIIAKLVKNRVKIFGAFAVKLIASEWQDIIDNWSIFAQIMTWSGQATSCYLNWYYPGPITSYCGSKPHSVNSLKVFVLLLWG